MPDFDLNRLERVLSPLTRLDLVFRLDRVKEIIDVRPTSILEVLAGNRLIVAQTEKPVTRRMVGRPVEVTFLGHDPEAGRPSRYGYRTVVRERLTGYMPHGRDPEEALVLGWPGRNLESTSLRLHYRVRPVREDGLSVNIAGLYGIANLMDISLGGMLVSVAGQTRFSLGQRIHLTLGIHDQRLSIEARVVRLFRGWGSNLILLGLGLNRMDKAATRLLQETVTRIMRSELKAHSGL